MIWFLICTFLCYILFLFFLYKLGREDFVLIRKDIALEQLFNLTFMTTIVAIFFGRLFYVMFHPSITFLNPLKFLVIPYFPGFLFPGAIAGAFLFLWYIHRKKRTPSGRLIDFYAVALLLIMPFLMLSEMFLLPRQDYLVQLILFFVYVITFFLFQFILMPRVGRGEIRDGTSGLIFLSVLCVISFLQDSVLYHSGIVFFLHAEDIFYLIVLLIIVISVTRKELFPQKRRR